MSAADLVEDYLLLGLSVGRLVEGMVDAYYGPPSLAQRASSGPPESAPALAERARRLRARLAADSADLEPRRRAWLSGQVLGLETTARKLAGESVAYLDEVERCYGVRPSYVDEERFAAAHRRLDEVVPGRGPLAARYITWREAQAVPQEKLQAAVASLAGDFRSRTRSLFGLPDGERVDFELETNKPWSGFNYYLGDLRSRVTINVDLPVLSLHLGSLVAHEAYPGHHTEHSRKEATLVRRRRQLEETIFLVGTPQCLVAEGLADLGLEVLTLAEGAEAVIAKYLRSLEIPYDAEVASQLKEPAEVLSLTRGNVAIGVHDRRWSNDEAIDYLCRWALLPRSRAQKQLDFIRDHTWRSYVFCYTEGLRLCRCYVANDAKRFEKLITEQVLPADLVAP
jgi:hypothetical protein